jgi:hypothetical protein
VNVFISWSGRKSQAVAIALREWLPGLINSVVPFVSSEDIYAGARWQSDIALQLDDSNFGIVCVTRENQATSWLNFEAGALAKSVDLSRLIPLAIDLKTTDVELPLGQFQAQPADEEGMRAVVLSLNKALGEEALADGLVSKSFDKWWPDLEAELARIESQTSAAAPPSRTDRELLEETLNTVRAVARRIDQPRSAVHGYEWLRNRAFAAALGNLPDVERQVVMKRYGLEGDGPQTLEAIGRSLGMTRERVRQIEGQALARLSVLPIVDDAVADSEDATD